MITLPVTGSLPPRQHTHLLWEGSGLGLGTWDWSDKGRGGPGESNPGHKQCFRGKYQKCHSSELASYRKTAPGPGGQKLGPKPCKRRAEIPSKCLFALLASISL